MPLPSRRPNPPRRPVRHPSSRMTSTGAVGVTGTPKPLGFTPTPAKPGMIAPGVGGALGVGTSPALPPDPTWDKQTASINQGTENTVTGLKGDRDRTLLDYGYNVQYDAEGNPLGNTLAFDPTNVFSRAAQLRKRWMESRSGTQNGMAAQGQMNSGAYGRAQRQVNYGESAATDAEIKGLQAFLARNGSQIAGARIAGQTALGEADAGRLDRVATNPLYSPNAAGGHTPPAASGRPDYNARPYQTQVVPGKGEWHVYKDGRRVFVRYK